MVSFSPETLKKKETFSQDPKENTGIEQNVKKKESERPTIFKQSPSIILYAR